MHHTFSRTPPEQAKKKADAAVALRTSFEESIRDEQQPTEARLHAFLQYLAFERRQTPQLRGRMRMLLERAVERFPCTVELWQLLTEHMEQEVATGGGSAALPEVSGKVLVQCYARACRNCPWKGVFWAGRLRAIEYLYSMTHADEEGSNEDSECDWAAHTRVYNDALAVRCNASILCCQHAALTPALPHHPNAGMGCLKTAVRRMAQPAVLGLVLQLRPVSMSVSAMSAAFSRTS
jgi:hypothetical protein